MESIKGALAENTATSRRKPSNNLAEVTPKERSRSIPENVPALKSFAHIRSPKVRRAKEYEQHLLILSSLYPEYSEGLADDLEYARSQQDRGRVSDRDRVLKQLEDCPLSCREVAEDLAIPYPTTYKILQALAETGLVEIRQRAGLHGQKPVCYYSLSHTRDSL